MEIHRLFRKDRLRREGEGVALYVLLPQDMDALKVVSMSQPCAGFCLKYHIAPQMVPRFKYLICKYLKKVR